MLFDSLIKRESQKKSEQVSELHQMISMRRNTVIVQRVTEPVTCARNPKDTGVGLITVHILSVNSLLTMSSPNALSHGSKLIKTSPFRYRSGGTPVLAFSQK